MEHSRDSAPTVPLPIHALDTVRPLSHREEEVVDLLAKGWSYVAIADALGLSVRTVQWYVEQIAQLLPYAPDEQVNRKEHVMLWAVHRVWHKYMKAAGRVYAPVEAPER